MAIYRFVNDTISLMKQRSGFDRRQWLIAAGSAAAVTFAGSTLGLLGGLSSDTHERRYGRFEELPINLKGTRLKFVGVDHTLGTFVQNEEKIREQIRRSPFVILEYFDSSFFDKAKPGSTRNDIRSLTLEAHRFFAGVAKICAEEHRDIVVVNPDSIASYVLNSLLMMGIPISTFLTLIDAKERHRLPMWKTLTAIAANVPALALWLGEAEIQGISNKDRELFSKVAAGEKDPANIRPSGVHHWDWRDVGTTKGVLLAKAYYREELEGEEMLMYHGLNHIRFVEYLAHPERREIKEKIYSVQNLLGNMSLRRYHFNEANDAWEEKESLPINTPI